MNFRYFLKKSYDTIVVIIFLLSLGANFTVSATSPENCIPDAFGNVTCTDYNANAALNIDFRIVNKHDPLQNLKIFNTQDHANRLYIRNTNHWTTGIDLTCISPYRSSPPVNQRAGTLITKRHVILTSHFQIAVGDSMRFITMDNQVVARKVIAKYDNTDWTQSYPDVEILLLDSNVPPSITPCKFLPSDYANFLLNDGKGLPVLITDQEEKGIVSELSNIKSLPYSPSMFSLRTPADPNRKALNENVISGDSGNPVFLIINGELVILGTFTYGGAGSGTSLTYLANLASGGGIPNLSINDQIALTDAKAGISTKYKISYFKFASPTENPEISSTEINVYTKNHCLRIHSDLDVYSEIVIAEITGKILFNKIVGLNNFEYPLSSSGVYFVRVFLKKKWLNYKILL